MYEPGGYRGTARAFASYNDSSAGGCDPGPDPTITRWARGTGTPATDLDISRHSYNWDVRAFKAGAGGSGTCGKPKSHRYIDIYPGIPEGVRIPLPSTLVLCGTLDVGKKYRFGGFAHMTGSWAFYPQGRLPKGQVLRHLPKGCAHIGQSEAKRYINW